MLKISTVSSVLPTQGSLILTMTADLKLGVNGQKLDTKLGGLIKRSIAASRFKGKKEQTLTILAPAKTRLSKILLIGLGEAADVTENICVGAGGAAAAALLNAGDALATLWFDTHKGVTLNVSEAAAHFGFGVRLRSYRFDKYRTKLKPEQKPTLKTLALAGDVAALKRSFATLDKLADGIFLTRDLVTEPSNILYPETLAEQCLTLEKLGVKVEVLDETAMAEMGMGALLGVAQGSVQPPRLVTMSWHGDYEGKDQRPVALVGKGVTFDTGGISLKPPTGMWDMKYDMAGAAAVIGTMKALAGRKAKANVVGIVGLVENMPDGKAQRPGDVVTSMSGQTIEVLNTDAEGRLVLADAIWFTQVQYNPRCLIDLATLTGAVRIALGSQYAGLFSNDTSLRDQLLASGKAVDESLWELPLHEAYDHALDSPIADIKNIADGSEAGSTMGAQFIQRFVKKGTVWAHLDIAAVTWLTKDKATAPKGASGYGVRLLDRLIYDNFETK